MASEQFYNGLNCSQSIIAKYAGKYNLDVATACQLATGFGGGMGRQAKTCGALTGAYLVLGLEFGSSSPADK
ncbi:MAG: C_GCAxxG_C_C family protein [Gammaproteobacteria bacterium]|nr:C_GCAxxG_C_C family protein [Gammaproteobacteria bacterium]